MHDLAALDTFSKSVYLCNLNVYLDLNHRGDSREAAHAPQPSPPPPHPSHHLPSLVFTVPMFSRTGLHFSSGAFHS